MANEFAYIMLILWPLVAFILFRKTDTLTAVFWTIVGGYLVLPVKVAIDLPMIPPLDQSSIPAISALIGCIHIKNIRISLIPKRSIERLLFLVLLTSPVITWFFNTEPYFNGRIWIPGLTLYDTISELIGNYLYLLPFIIGLQVVKTSGDQLKLARYIVIACLLYSLPILFEVRMSPQLHTWVYGFFPHSFRQQFRLDGFRAVVFLGHGLLVAIFVATSLGSAAILLKNNIKTFGISALAIVCYFIILLILSKSAGALILGFILLCSILFLPNYISARVAVYMVIFVFSYPILSLYNLIPSESLVEIAANIFGEERAGSLRDRFYHEQELLTHAKEKILSGWGAWGRHLPSWYTVTDGRAVRVLSVTGLYGYVTFFGLILLTVVRSKNSLNMVNNRLDKNLLTGHMLIVGVIMLDQITNGSINNMALLLIGALLGRANSLYVVRKAPIHQTNYNMIPTKK